MESSPEISLDLEEINKELEEIEAKLTSTVDKTYSKLHPQLVEGLIILSKEFDCLGLPEINIEDTSQNILEQVLKTSRKLVQMHQNTVIEISEKNLRSVGQDNRYKLLHAKVYEYEKQLEQMNYNYHTLKNTNSYIDEEMKEMRKREQNHQDEMKKVKRTFFAREQFLENEIKKLQIEIDRLKSLFGNGIESKNEVALNLLKDYREREGVYKTTITKMQENMQEFMDEILSLKEEVILSRAMSS